MRALHFTRGDGHIGPALDLCVYVAPLSSNCIHTMAKAYFSTNKWQATSKALICFINRAEKLTEIVISSFLFQPFPTRIFGHTLEIKSILFGKFNVILLRWGIAKSSRAHHYNWNVFKKKKKRLVCLKRCIQQKLLEGAAY